MFENYKIIAVIPAGRKKFLRLLFAYLNDNRHILDGCQIWQNTKIQEDIKYIEQAGIDPFYKVIKPQFVTQDVIYSIHQFFKWCLDEDTIYIRFDDDICYIAPDAIENLLRFRIDNPNYFLVYPHIVNNSMNVCVDNPVRHLTDWYRGRNEIIKKHEIFLDNINDPNYFKIENSVNTKYLRYNINCICWFGKEFKKFGGRVHSNEEQWLAQDKPRQIKTPVAVCGNSVVCHYSFKTQKNFLSNTNILTRYESLKFKNFVSLL